MIVRDALQLWRLERNLHASPAGLEALQFAKLRTLAQRAYDNVPYCRTLFDGAGLHPTQLRSLADLTRIPISSKSEYRRANPDDRVTVRSRAETPLVFPTSGSSGTPLRIYMTAAERRTHALYTLRAERAVGVGARHHVALISPRFRDSPTDLGAIPGPRWFERLGLLPRHYLDVWEDPERQWMALKALRPQVLVSYPSHFGVLIEVGRRLGLGDWRPQFIFTNSEPLSVGAREAISEFFSAPVFQHYDSWETHLIGWECERRDGLHINADHLILEIRDGDRAAQSGEVVVTNLDLHTMPIIRYALGDHAELATEPCACGRSLPRLRAVHGRQGDVATLPNGRTLSMIAIHMMLSHLEGVIQFRIVQESIERFVVEILPSPTFSRSQAQSVLAWIREHTGDQVSFAITMVSAIEPDPSGKRPLFVSRI